MSQAVSSGPRVYEHASWKSFRDSLFDYAAQPRSRREQLLFRGQSYADWPLCTTLDRLRPFESVEERAVWMASLLVDFRQEAMRVSRSGAPLPRGEALELLARHHGLPSPLVDWSASPYAAAFFAYSKAMPDQDRPVAVWNIDKTRLPPTGEGVDLIDDLEMVQANRRALHQHSAFMRIDRVGEPLEQILGDALTKFLIPAHDRDLALADLDIMGVNATVLFDDFDGAATTARTRVLCQEVSNDTL